MYVTHDQEEAFSMSDRVAVMNRGLLEHVGSPSEVYSQPCTLFVADFVGASNGLNGTVVQQRGDRSYSVNIPTVADAVEVVGVSGGSAKATPWWPCSARRTRSCSPPAPASWTSRA